MFSNTVVMTSSNTFPYLKILLPDTSAKQCILVFANDQYSSFDRSHLFAITSISLRIPKPRYSEAYLTMLASEQILRRDWEQPEEDEAWANL